jgi:hypothetical protein
VLGGILTVTVLLILEGAMMLRGPPRALAGKQMMRRNPGTLLAVGERGLLLAKE